MQIASAPSTNPSSVPPRDLIVGEPGSPVMSGADPRFTQYKVIRRNGSVVAFEPSKITIAMTKAFLAINGGQGAASARVREQVTKLTDGVVAALVKRKPEGGAIHIEEIQDQVELQLMRGGEHEVARAYVLYREKRSQERAQAKGKEKGKAVDHAITVNDSTRQDGHFWLPRALIRGRDEQPPGQYAHEQGGKEESHARLAREPHGPYPKRQESQRQQQP